MNKLIVRLSKTDGQYQSVPLPEGRWPVEVTDVQYATRENENGPYAYIMVAYRLNNGGGKFHGMRLSSFHIVEHSNQRTTEIATEQLSRIVTMSGVEFEDGDEVDLSDVVGKQLYVRTAWNEKFSRNDVRGWYADAGDAS